MCEWELKKILKKTFIINCSKVKERTKKVCNLLWIEYILWGNYDNKIIRYRKNSIDPMINYSLLIDILIWNIFIVDFKIRK